MKTRDNMQNASSANEIAVLALVFLAEDNDRLGHFLALSGLDPRTIREAARDPGFLVGVLDHLMGDEKLLVAFAAVNDLRPQQITDARTALAGPLLN
jgi:Protein of unknown function (DUF3572)